MRLLLSKRGAGNLIRNQKWTMRVLSVGLAFACFYFSRTLIVWRNARAQTVITPYVLQTEATSFVEGENAVLTYTEARRSDGALMKRSPGPWRNGIRAGETVRTLRFADGRFIKLFDSIGVKSTWPAIKPDIEASHQAQVMGRAPDCVFIPDESFVGYDELLGQKVAIVNGIVATRDANEAWTYWRAPALGCHLLQYRVEAIEPDGSRRLQLESRPLSLMLQEPDPALFDEGEGYTELAPSEASRREAQRLSVTLDATFEQQSKVADEIYSKRRAAAGQ